MNRGTMLPFDKIRVYLDEEYESAEKFTVSSFLEVSFIFYSY